MAKPALRERLLGALVFLCLGLILYPVFFDTSSRPVVDRESQIPPQLVRITPLQIEDPVVPAAAQNAPVASAEIFLPREEVVAEAVPNRSEAILDPQGVPEAWVLQVGSFSAQANANEVESRLQQAGYRAYQRPSGSLYRVLVGPYLERRIAEREQQEIEQLGLGKPLLMDFSP